MICRDKNNFPNCCISK